MLLPPPGSAPGGFCFPGFAPCEKNGCNLKRLWYNSTAHRRCVEHYASVAQWIEHQIPVLGVGGSSPFGRARRKPCNDDVTGLFLRVCLGLPIKFWAIQGWLGRSIMDLWQKQNQTTSGAVRLAQIQQTTRRRNKGWRKQGSLPRRTRQRTADQRGDGIGIDHRGHFGPPGRRQAERTGVYGPVPGTRRQAAKPVPFHRGGGAGVALLPRRM